MKNKLLGLILVSMVGCSVMNAAFPGTILTKQTKPEEKTALLPPKTSASPELTACEFHCKNVICKRFTNYHYSVSHTSRGTPHGVCICTTNKTNADKMPSTTLIPGKDCDIK